LATPTSVRAIAPSQIYLVFLVSGASALVYQVIWSRWLGLVFGNTTASVSIILSAFMGGLAIGSHVVGKRLPRIVNPLRAYALVELGIGAFALLFPSFTSLMASAFTAVVAPETPPAVALAIRATCAFALLLVPTALMGATLPLLTDFFRRHPLASREWKVGALYAANTLGAALGVLTTSLVLIELVGVWATTVLAALLNFGVAAFAWNRSRTQDAASTAIEQAAPVTTSGGPVQRAATIALALSGGLAMAGEVLWTRNMETAIGTSTYAFSCVVFVFLVGIASGSSAMSLRVSKVKDHQGALAALLLFMALWMVVSIVLFRVIGLDARARIHDAASIGTALTTYVAVALLLVPLAFASGACFPVATRMLNPSSDDAGGAAVARAYAWNTVGSVAGSLLAGFVIAPSFDFAPSLFVVAGGYVMAGVWCAVQGATGRAQRRAHAVGGLIIAVVVGVAASQTPAMLRTWGEGIEVISHQPGLQGVTTVLRRHGAPSAGGLLVNGYGMTTKIPDTKMMAHAPMALHPAPRNVLVICFGMGTTYRSALSHGAEVTVVELVPKVLEAFPFFFADATDVLANPKGRRIVNDGRNFLLMTRERFDVITLDPPPPIDGAGVNNLYSRDFVELARSRLTPGGIFAHWIPMPGTAAGVHDTRTVYMLVDTIRGAFPYVYGLNSHDGVGVHIIASDTPITATVSDVQQRLGAPRVAADVREFGAVSLDFFAKLRPVEAPAADALIVTDDHPLLEFNLLRRALSSE